MKTTMIQHHPDDATLMSYAAGALEEALATVVATHLAMCPECRREVRSLERLGGAMMEGLTVGDIDDRAVDKAIGAIGEAAFERNGGQPSRRRAVIKAHGDMPGPLGHLLGVGMDDIPWRPLAPGVRHFKLPLSPGAEGDLRLLKIQPSRRMPEHGHGGAEITLVLRGSYTDELGTFRRGDVADLDDDIEHQPMVDDREPCICLVASVQPARFKGVFARLFQPIVGM